MKMEMMCKRNESKSKQKSHNTMDQTKNWEKGVRNWGLESKSESSEY